MNIEKHITCTLKCDSCDFHVTKTAPEDDVDPVHYVKEHFVRVVVEYQHDCFAGLSDGNDQKKWIYLCPDCFAKGFPWVASDKGVPGDIFLRARYWGGLPVVARPDDQDKSLKQALEIMDASSGPDSDPHLLRTCSLSNSKSASCDCEIRQNTNSSCQDCQTPVARSSEIDPPTSDALHRADEEGQ